MDIEKNVIVVGDSHYPSILHDGIYCSAHGKMLCYGRHGQIKIYRCEQIYGTCLELWKHDNGRIVQVTPHIEIKGEEGQHILNVINRDEWELNTDGSKTLTYAKLYPIKLAKTRPRTEFFENGEWKLYEFQKL